MWGEGFLINNGEHGDFAGRATHMLAELFGFGLAAALFPQWNIVHDLKKREEIEMRHRSNEASLDTGGDYDCK
jgi:hypothetical protein